MLKTKRVDRIDTDKENNSLVIELKKEEDKK
jgi:hypothetical protein